MLVFALNNKIDIFMIKLLLLILAHFSSCYAIYFPIKCGVTYYTVIVNVPLENRNLFLPESDNSNDVVTVYVVYVKIKLMRNITKH